MSEFLVGDEFSNNLLIILCNKPETKLELYLMVTKYPHKHMCPRGNNSSMNLQLLDGISLNITKSSTSILYRDLVVKM